MPQKEITQVKRSEIGSPEFRSALFDRNNNPEKPGSDEFYEVAAAILKWRPERVRFAVSLLLGEQRKIISPDWSEARLVDIDGEKRLIIKKLERRR